MIIPDINLLIYAYNDQSPFHDAARRWWENALNGDESVGIPWVVSTGFIRIMANSSSVASPVSPAEAAGYVEEWFQYGHVVPINPGDDHMRYLRQNLQVAGAGRNLVADAHIAAIAMEHQAEVYTNDSDFARFPGLQWRNPLPQAR